MIRAHHQGLCHALEARLAMLLSCPGGPADGHCRHLFVLVDDDDDDDARRGRRISFSFLDSFLTCSSPPHHISATTSQG